MYLGSLSNFFILVVFIIIANLVGLFVFKKAKSKKVKIAVVILYSIIYVTIYVLPLVLVSYLNNIEGCGPTQSSDEELSLQTTILVLLIYATVIFSKVVTLCIAVLWHKFDEQKK